MCLQVFALGVFASLDSAAAKAFLTMADTDEGNIYAITSDKVRTLKKTNDKKRKKIQKIIVEKKKKKVKKV
jgi:hypothetical protein